MSTTPHLHSVRSKVREKLSLVEEMAGSVVGPRKWHESDQVRERKFWSMVKVKPNGCWEWQGSFRDKQRYGAFWVNGRDERSHRVSWTLTFGAIPTGMHVLHNCDNPPCVRPDHLFLGTQADNNRDMVAKGRNTWIHGDQSHCAKLNDGKVRRIKQLLLEGKFYHREIAEQFSVSRTTIEQIHSGIVWKHVKL